MRSFIATDGFPHLLYDGGADLFHRLIREIRGEDYGIVYNSVNSFRFMGMMDGLAVGF